MIRWLQHWLGGGGRAFAAQDTLAPPVASPTPVTDPISDPPTLSQGGHIGPPLQDSALARWRPPQTWPAAWIIARREMADVVSDWRILAPALLVVGVFPLLVVVMTAQGAPFLARRVPNFHIDVLVPFGVMVVGFFPISFALMMALETFAGEKERNTLEALFASPLSDRAIYLGKLIAALIPPLIASYLSMGLYLAGAILLLHARIDPLVLLALLALEAAQALVLVAGALILSSHTTSVRAANLLASFLLLPMSLLLQLNNLVVIGGAAPALWLVAAGLALFALLLLRMGLRLFNREMILTREGDDFKLGRAGATYRRLLALPPRWALAAHTPDAPAVPPGLRRLTLWRLYRHDVPVLLRLRWPELALVTGALVVAFAIGWNAAALFHVVSRPGLELGTLVTPGTTTPRLAGGDAALLLAQIPGLVLTSLLLAGLLIVLGVISFGTLPVLFMMLVAGLFGLVLGTLPLLGMPAPVVLAALVLPQISFPALAFVVLTAFSARFGLAIMAPPPGFGLGESLLLAAAEYTKMLVVVVPLLIGGFVLQGLVVALFVH